MARFDLTVLAIPAYIGAMGAEYVWLRRHPAPEGTPRAGDYELSDTIASLTMVLLDRIFGTTFFSSSTGTLAGLA